MAATLASAAWLLSAMATGQAALLVRDTRVPCSAAQYAPPTPAPGYRTVLGAAGLPRATSNSTPTKYVIGHGTQFQRQFAYAVFQTLLVRAGTAPITLTVPEDWTGRELLTTDLQRTSRSAQAFASIHFDECRGLAAFHPHLAYSFTILVPRSGCYPLNVRVGARRARISLNLSLEQTRACRPGWHQPLRPQRSSATPQTPSLPTRVGAAVLIHSRPWRLSTRSRFAICA